MCREPTCRGARPCAPAKAHGRAPLHWAALACLVLVANVGLAQDEDVEQALAKPLASGSLLLDGVAVDGLMVAVGERGHVLVSRDQGESWTQAAVPTRATLTGVFFHDAQLGWAVGHDAVILRTRDGGESWTRLYHAPEEERPFLDVWFKDASEGFAIGAYGFFLKTVDGGDTWSPHEFIDSSAEPAVEDDPYAYDESGDYHLNHIARAQDGRLYIAAEAGTAYRSEDGGETWTMLSSPYEGSFFGTLPLGGDSLLLFGLRGNLFRSGDAGESWQRVASGTEAMLADGLRLADGTIVLAGAAGTLLVSGDGGETFRLEQQADRQALATVLPAGDSLVLIGEFGVNKIPAPTP